MKTIRKFLIFAACLALFTSFAACQFYSDDQRGEDDSAYDDIAWDGDRVRRTVIFRTVNPRLCEKYMEETLPQTISRTKCGIVGIEVTVKSESGSVRNLGTGIVIANPFYKPSDVSPSGGEPDVPGEGDGEGTEGPDDISADEEYGPKEEDYQNADRVFIATSCKLIEGANAISVISYDGNRSYTAKVYGIDPQTDTCVLMLDENEKPDFLRPVDFYEDCSDIAPGNKIFSVSNTFGEQTFRVACGIVSGRDFLTDVGEGNKNRLFVTDMAYLSGSLGGGIFTEKGGFLTGMICSSGGRFGDSVFAVPADTLRSVCGELIKKGYVEGRYKLGITVADNRSSWGRVESVEVTSVLPDGSMYGDGKNGLQQGDKIISLKYGSDAQIFSINSSEALYSYLYDKPGLKPGDRLIFWINRAGKDISVEITICQYNPLKRS